MERGLFIAMSGAKQNMLAQTSHANNLANASTNGFRADFAQARSMPMYYGNGHPTRAFSMTERPATDFKIGSAIETGRDLDLMISGDGFFVVQAPDGNPAMTRTGDLHVGPDGQLVTGNGLPVLGNGGPIVLPQLEKVEIGIDGSVSGIVAGDVSATIAQLDQLRLVNPDVSNIEKGEDGLFRMRNEDALAPDATVKVTSGFLESSNVNTINEFTNMLSLSRQYEMQVKMMQTFEQKSESSARLLQIN